MGDAAARELANNLTLGIDAARTRGAGTRNVEGRELLATHTKAMQHASRRVGPDDVAASMTRKVASWMPRDSQTSRTRLCAAGTRDRQRPWRFLRCRLWH